MRNVIRIKKKALQDNLEAFQDYCSNCLVTPILKSNAYGHGLKEVYSILAEKNPEAIGVNDAAEGELLRNLGFQKRLILVGPIHPDTLSQAYRLNAEISLADQALLEAWLLSKEKPKAHLKVDTGLSRQGFTLDDTQKALEKILPHKEKLLGLFSHFANVEDVLEHQYAQKQLSQFKQAIKLTTNHQLNLELHIASSASILLLKESHYDLTRLGISLYGLWPSKTTKLSFEQVKTKPLTLTPALTWESELASIKKIKEGTFVGYGCTFKAIKDMTIAVVPVGYNEGYPRLASSHPQAHVLVRGHRCPILGRICMNMLMIDVTHIKDAAPFDKVTLIGTDGSETIAAETLAEWADTIHYELLTRLNPGIERIIT